MKNLKKLPTPIKLLAIYLALLVATYLLLISPKLALLKGLQGELRRLEGEVKKAQEIEALIKLPGMEEKRKWEAVKEKVARAPKVMNLPYLMEELRKQALANNISDASFSSFRSPPPSQSKESTLKMSDLLIRISFHSEYRELALFLKGMDDLSQWVAIESLEVKKASPLISAELHVRPILSGLEKK
jgi:Tfp pilus assembly protein PilO